MASSQSDRSVVVESTAGAEPALGVVCGKASHVSNLFAAWIGDRELVPRLERDRSPGLWGDAPPEGRSGGQSGTCRGQRQFVGAANPEYCRVSLDSPKSARPGYSAP
jgi:hypothetical protein